MRIALLLIVILFFSTVLAQRADLFPLGIPRLADDETVAQLLEEQGYRPQEAFNRRDNPNGEQAYTGEAHGHPAQIVTKKDDRGIIDTVQFYIVVDPDTAMSRSKLRELRELFAEIENDLTAQFGLPAYTGTYNLELNGTTQETPSSTWEPGGREAGDKVSSRIVDDGYILITYHRKMR